MRYLPRLLLHVAVCLLWAAAWVAAILFVASMSTGCALMPSKVRELKRTTTERVTFEDGSAIERSRATTVSVTKTPPPP